MRRGEVEKTIREKRESWVSPETRRLLASKAAALHANKSDLVAERGKTLRRQLWRDRKERIRKVSAEIEERLVTKEGIEAYALLRSWYRSYDGKASTPSEEALEKVRSSYAKLYTKDDLGGGLPFDFQYEGDQVLDKVPSDGELGIALSRIRNRKAPGLFWLSVDTLKE